MKRQEKAKPTLVNLTCGQQPVSFVHDDIHRGKRASHGETSVRGSISATTLFLGVYAVAQMVEALRYKSECSGFDSRW